MPSADTFEQQTADYKEQVLPAAITNGIAIEAGHPDFWFKYVGLQGKVIGMNRFGESAPASELFNEFGFNVDNVVNMSQQMLSE